jgi:hypothetical protein
VRENDVLPTLEKCARSKKTFYYTAILSGSASLDSMVRRAGAGWLRGLGEYRQTCHKSWNVADVWKPFLLLQ